MVVRRGAIAVAVFAIFTLMSAGAGAQSPAPQPGAAARRTSAPAAAPAAQPAPAPAAPAAATPAPQTPKVDQAAIVKKANDAVGLAIDSRIKNWREELDRIEQGIHGPLGGSRELNEYRTRLLNVRADAEGFWKKLEPVLNSANENVQALAPAPAQNQAPEPEQAALYREETTAYEAYLISARGALDGTHARINSLLKHLLDIGFSNRAKSLAKRVPGIFSLETWKSAPADVFEVADKVHSTAVAWWDAQDEDQIGPLLAVAVALWLGLRFFSAALVRRLRRWDGDGEPAFWRRASDAAGIILLRSVPAVLPLVFLYNAANNVQAFPETIGALFYTATLAIVVIVVINALISTALSPTDRRWRLIPASNAAAVRMSGLMLTVAVVYGAATFLQHAARLFSAPNPAILALTLIPNAIIALLAAATLWTPLREDRADGQPQALWLGILRLPAWLAVLAIVATAAAGYLRLSRFIAQQLIVTGAILTIVYLLLLWADGVAHAMSKDNSALGRWFASAFKLDHASRQKLSIPVSLLLKFGVLLAGVPLILNQWEFSWPDIFEWYRQLFFGFHVGSTEVSLAAFLAFIVIFTLGYSAAKFFQQWLDAQVLKPAGLSGGLRESIRTAVGYIGISAAALVALSYAGFNLSNLAIVAGAFSVGIGFGLQSVVNNFVSGLILLAERPIKVGDLVVAGGEEGYVRKISVRSTEIETFDGANVLIPNSFFISEKVKNWTLRNNTGRVTIGVRVPHGTDPRRVSAILLQVAQKHAAVMVVPKPSVYFDDFGAGTLDFKLFAFIQDLNSSSSVRTELRLGILDAFEAEGIAIASEQTDVALRDVDWLKDAVAVYVARALSGQVPGNGAGTAQGGRIKPSE